MDFAEIEKRVRDAEVTQLDDYERGHGDAPVLFRAVSFDIDDEIVTKARDDGDKLPVLVASTDDEDRGGDVINQSGWNLKNFRKNPVYMWAHNYALPPIGSVPKVWKEGNQLLNTVKFDDDGFSQEIARKFTAKILRAQSVGFRPTDFEEREREDGKKGLFGSFLFKKNELLEISGVPIPMNQAALAKSLELMEKAPSHFFMPGIPDLAVENLITTAAGDATVDEPVDAEEKDLDVKEGRVLAKRHVDALAQAHEAIGKVLLAAQGALSEDDEPDSSKSIDGDDEDIEDVEEIEDGDAVITTDDAESLVKAIRAVTQEDD
jgi:hypothetical protein